MPTRPSKDVVPKTIELNKALVAEAEAFAAERGQSFRFLVEKALRRHLDSPPPVTPDPPLPPGEPDPPIPKKKPQKRGRKPRGEK